MGMVGADVGGLRSLAGQLRERAQLIEGILARLEPVVTDLPWIGADRDRFVAEWQQVHRQGLLRLVLDLRDASGTAARRADEQEDASRAAGGHS